MAYKIEGSDGYVKVTHPIGATGTVTLDSGGAGSVDGITVNSVEIMSGAENFDSDLSTTATAVAANITANTSIPNYSASATGAVITITDVSGQGSDANAFVVASSTTTIASTDTNMIRGAHTTRDFYQKGTLSMQRKGDDFHFMVLKRSSDYFSVSYGADETYPEVDTTAPVHASADALETALITLLFNKT